MSVERPGPTAEPEAGPAGAAPEAEAPPAKRVFEVDFLTELFHNPLDAGYQDAATARQRSGPSRPAAKAFGFTLRTVALVAIGMLLVIAYKQTIAAQPEASKVRAGLVSDVQQRQADTDQLQQRAEALRQEAARLRDAVVGNGAGVLDAIEARTGLGAVTGDGAEVRLASGPPPVDPLTGKPLANDQGHILDFDLQTITNELWHAGAEAISINGQRIIATTTIRRAGNAILVDLAPLQEPYVIDAIGPPDLADRLRGSSVGNFYSYLHTSYGVRFDVAAEQGLTLHAAADPQLRYATPIPTPGPSGSPGPSGPPSPAPSTSTPTSPPTPPSGGH